MAGEKGKRRKRGPRKEGAGRHNHQFERFIDSAKALGVKESREAFDKALRGLLKLKPKGKRGSS